MVPDFLLLQIGCLLLARDKALPLHHLSTDSSDAQQVKVVGNETTQESDDHDKKQVQKHNLQVWNKATLIIPSVNHRSSGP